MHLENMTEEQLQEALVTAEENPDTKTVMDRNGNTGSIKIEQIENYKHKHELQKWTNNTKINENKNNKPYIELW